MLVLKKLAEHKKNTKEAKPSRRHFKMNHLSCKDDICIKCSPIPSNQLCYWKIGKTNINHKNIIVALSEYICMICKYTRQ